MFGDFKIMLVPDQSESGLVLCMNCRSVCITLNKHSSVVVSKTWSVHTPLDDAERVVDRDEELEDKRRCSWRCKH